MPIKTKNFLRNPKQSFLFFLFIFIIIFGSLVYLFIQNNKRHFQPKTQNIVLSQPIEEEDDQYSVEEEMPTETPLSTPIPSSVKRISPTKPQLQNKKPIQPPKTQVPLSANSSNPTKDVDPWGFISHLPTEDTRLNSKNREQTNNYFLEGLTITTNYSGSLERSDMEQPFETENFRGGEGFTYLH